MEIIRLATILRPNVPREWATSQLPAEKGKSLDTLQTLPVAAAFSVVLRIVFLMFLYLENQITAKFGY